MGTRGERKPRHRASFKEKQNSEEIDNKQNTEHRMLMKIRVKKR